MQVPLSSSYSSFHHHLSYSFPHFRFFSFFNSVFRFGFFSPSPTRLSLLLCHRHILFLTIFILVLTHSHAVAELTHLGHTMCREELSEIAYYLLIFQNLKELFRSSSINTSLRDGNGLLVQRLFAQNL